MFILIKFKSILKINMKKLSINTLKHKQVNQKLFMTMDIETMSKDKFQVPVAISLAYFDKEGSIKNKVVVINSNLLVKNEDIAIKDLWSRFFDFLILILNENLCGARSRPLNQNHISNFIRVNNKNRLTLKKRFVNFKIKNNLLSHSSQNLSLQSLSGNAERKLKTMHIFMHNLGKFDGIYLVKGLLKIIHYNKVKTIINKENEFIEINAKMDNFKLIWKDSLRIFNVSLKELCEIFNTKTKKLHSYKSEYNDISLFKNTLLLNEFKEYSAQDSISLLEALKLAQDLYSNLHNVDITSIWSASTLAMKIFRLKYLKKSIPTLKKYLDYFIRESYFGGITDVYKLYGENIFYYDVNSLYPYAMLNPMPSKMIKYYDSMKEIDFSDFFGFCKAIIKAPNNLDIPLLPFRLKNGNVIYPTGQWTGTYFSEELKAVMKYGYRIIPLQGYSFEKEYYFNDYVNYFYNLKKNTNGPLRFIIKGLLNNIYGYFGRSLDLISTVNVNSNHMKEYLTHKLIHNILPIDEKTGIYILLFSDDLKQNSVKNLNLNLITAPGLPLNENENELISSRSASESLQMSKYVIESKVNNHINRDNSPKMNIIQDTNFKRIPNSFVRGVMRGANTSLKRKRDSGVKANVAIASAVTSYARINMINLKMKLIQMGYVIYYSDTDSLFIDRPLPESMINNELGGFKDELKGMIINKVYFLGEKKYGYQIKLPDGSVIDKSVFAGITRNSLSFNEIEKLAKGEVLRKTKLIQFNRDLEHLKIQIKENIPVHLQKSTNKKIIDNNYIAPHINQHTIREKIKLNYLSLNTIKDFLGKY